MVSMVVVNWVLAGVAGLLAAKWLLDKLSARNVRRAAARTVGVALAKLGFVKFPEFLFSYSDGDYREFVQRLKDIIKMFDDPAKVLEELGGAMKKMATMPEGLKMLKDAIASVETTTPAPAPAV